MTDLTKSVESLRASDLEKFPVWRYTNRDLSNELSVRPLKRLPVSSLTGNIVGVRVKLANGQLRWALIGNVDETNARMTEHLLTLSLEQDGKWLSLARYHDFDYQNRGPDALARSLGLTVDQVFPIEYDLRPYASGDEAALNGIIPREPRERLTRAEIIAMAVP